MVSGHIVVSETSLGLSISWSVGWCPSVMISIFFKALSEHLLTVADTGRWGAEIAPRAVQRPTPSRRPITTQRPNKKIVTQPCLQNLILSRKILCTRLFFTHILMHIHKYAYNIHTFIQYMYTFIRICRYTRNNVHTLYNV